jgi:hypothetical protein
LPHAPIPFLSSGVAMAEKSLEDSKANGQLVEEEALVPEDERFWQRYSPHHEFPLSTSASVALHVVAIAVLVLGGVLAAKWGLGDSEKPIPISMMDEPGGGGQPEGKDAGTGSEGAVQSKEATESPSNTVADATPVPKENLNAPTVDPVDLPKIQDPSARYIDESAEAMKGLAKLDEQTRKNLFNSLRDPAKGKGGSGTGGGKGTGTGTGSGTASGEGNLNVRQKRVLRWEVNFRVMSPEDHLRQFAALGAILAVPDPQGRYHVFRDLYKRSGRVEDLSNINRIWFIDRNPETVAGISSLLRMPQPPVLIAFFPQDLEKRMAEMEQRYRGQREDDIHEKFVFQVVPRGGTYEVVVGDRQP